MSDVEHDEAALLADAAKYAFRGRIDKSSATGPVFVSARGSVVTDVTGKEYLDLNSGQACAVLGHNHEHVVAAIREACDTMLHAHSSYYNVKEIELAARLAGLFPAPLRKSLYGESGSDANELAIVIARMYTSGEAVFSPHVSYHGMSLGARAVTFAGWRRGHGRLDTDAHPILAPYCYRCPLAKTFPSCDFACLTASFELVDAQATAQPAAVITEPLFSAGGVIDPPPGWLRRLGELCESRGMLLIVDEEQTGLGKLGVMFGFGRDGVVPGIVTLAKHFGGGVGISSVTTSAEIEDAVSAAGFTATRSHSNDPLLCAAGLASLEVVIAEDVPASARRIGDHLRARLAALMDRYELIGDIRGTGLLLGVELVTDRDSREPATAEGNEIGRLCLEDGLIFSMRRGGSVLRFMPPASTTPGQIDHAADILESAFERVSATGRG